MRRRNLKCGSIRSIASAMLVVVLMLSASVSAVAAPKPTHGPTLTSALPPPNDNRNAATSLGSLPATVRGTTEGSTVEIHEPESGCARVSGSVWYEVSFGGSPPGEVGVKVNANGDLDAVVDVFQRQRSQNNPVACQSTDTSGTAGLTFSPSADATYLIRIAERANSDPGTFSLKVFDVPPPPAPPGVALGARGGHGVLDGTFDTEAAYSLRLTAGTTYKINLVKSNDGCMGLGIYPPGATSFADGSVAGLDCAGYRLFTPTVGGLWSFLITADSNADGSQPFWLHVAPATSLEMAPGISLPNLSHYTGFLRGNLNSDVRLFRFDVTSRSDLTLFLQTATNDAFDLKLLNDNGQYLQCDCGSTGEETIRRQTAPGRYFVVVQAENFESGPFTLSRQSRTITYAHVGFDGFGYEQIAPRASTRVIARISPAVSGPVTIELQYFDPVERWQFRRDYHLHAVNGIAVLSFTPPKIGRWRATVAYTGTRSAAPATSGWANLLVAGPLTE